jgi:hypothetical protein
MDYQSEKLCVLERDFYKDKKERMHEKFNFISLKDVPLEARRKEAKKPLFLVRYE